MAATSTLIRNYEPLDARRRCATGFLARYSGIARASYTTDLRLFAPWCAEHGLRLPS